MEKINQLFPQRIGQSLRQGGHADIQLERFEEALHNPSAELTYTALSGIHKQSVENVERLFDESVINWMERKGYTTEAEYLHVIRNWRHSCDERGLTSTQHSQFNNNLLKYILDELMPWHTENGLEDFSLLEVNRYY